MLCITNVLTGENSISGKNFIRNKLAMIEYGIRTVGKNLFIRKFRQRRLKNAVCDFFAMLQNFDLRIFSRLACEITLFAIFVAKYVRKRFMRIFARISQCAKYWQIGHKMRK